jgi:hypothetical protein
VLFSFCFSTGTTAVFFVITVIKIDPRGVAWEKKSEIQIVTFTPNLKLEAQNSQNKWTEIYI